jgi:hypothetical protein|tara:strand:- start:1263 stop:1541 length:279 start_codon:yes stop_codon:yes gene_type:complete
MSRDENSQPVPFGVNSSGQTLLRVDPATGRLIIAVQNTTSTSPSGVVKKVDENSHPVDFVVTDSAPSVAAPLIVDSRTIADSPLLFIDLNIE